MIVLIASVVLHDGLPGDGVGSGIAPRPPTSLDWIATGAMLLAMVAIAAATHAVCWAATRMIDRRGSLAAVRSADRMLLAGQTLAVVTHVLGVFIGGWVDVVRWGLGVGDLIIVDEAIAILPAIMVIAVGWWSFYPIERRLRESVWMRVLEEGHPLYPTPTRSQFVLSSVRHQLLLTLVPLLMIGAWSESVDRALGWIHRGGADALLPAAGEWLRQSPDHPAIAGLIGRIVGVIVVLCVSSLVMRCVWETIRLSDGPLRDRLLGLCGRAEVRVRDLLVWRTRGTMVNGAAMGLVAPLRYILLTDALLDHLPTRQVESVMAHEIAHVRHRHIPWLLAALIGSIGVFGVLSVLPVWGLSIWLAPAGIDDDRTPPWWLVNAEALMAGPMLAGVLLTFGWVSRRFEWQADAFAARLLSIDPDTPLPPGVQSPERVTQESVDAMVGALASVAELNHIPIQRRSFRHGSIRVRQRRLNTLVGRPLNTLPIDRQVRWIKGAIVVALILTAAMVVLETTLLSGLLDAGSARSEAGR